MSTPILFAQIVSIMNVLKQTPPQSALKGTCYKFNGQGEKTTVVGSLMQADGFRIKIQDETEVAQTLARLATAAGKVGKQLRAHFETQIDAQGKQVRVTDDTRPYYSLAPAQGGGFWLDARLSVPQVSI
jgi:hypothetical protein